jgi:hypothetical protein
MNKHTTHRYLAEGERGRFTKFLIRENLKFIQSLYPKSFWEYYEANIIGMAYFSCPILYSDYFEDGDLIRTFICADENGDWDFPSVFWWFKQNREGAFERLTPQSASYNKSEGTLVCICGNSFEQEGFYPCTPIGSEIEPTHEARKHKQYACDSCGRIINRETLEVEGFRQPDYTYLK